MSEHDGWKQDTAPPVHEPQTSEGDRATFRQWFRTDIDWIMTELELRQKGVLEPERTERNA